MFSTISVRSLHRDILSLTEGVFGHTVDLALWFLAFSGELALPSRSYNKINRAATNADRLVQKVNYEFLKNAFTTAKKQGLIVGSGRHGKKASPRITQEGLRRLAEIVPHYDEVRSWDNRLYLVTYDISERKRRYRDLLRKFLRRIGCGMLQASVWITPYNPKDILRQFIGDYQLSGALIVSDIGTDGAIGDEDIKDLIVRVYRLEELNRRYCGWLDKYGHDEPDAWAVVQYFAILDDDPQLPFVLYPSWWCGDEVYNKVKTKLHEYESYVKRQAAVSQLT